MFFANDVNTFNGQALLSVYQFNEHICFFLTVHFWWHTLFKCYVRMVKSVGNTLEPLVAIPLAASFNEHKTVCKKMLKNCGHCYWQAKSPQIMKQLECWIKDFDKQTIFIDKRMAGLGGSFGIGCLTCHKFSGNQKPFSKFRVCDPNMMQANKLLRHLRSASHIQAQARSLNGHPGYSESSRSRNQLGVPTPKKFVWAMQSCFNCASFRDWTKLQKQGSGSSTECLRDVSPKMCKQLLFASSMPVATHNQHLLQKAVRIALSVDDKDPVFLCRMKLVVTDGTTQCHRLFGGVLNDCSHDVKGSTTNILNLVDQLAMKRQGRRDHSGITGPGDQIDEEFSQQIKKKVFCICTDGAEVMVRSVQKLKIDNHFPNLRYQWRDAAHSTNCIGKNVEKHANPENELKEFLITGDASFVKRIRNSSSARDEWMKMGGGDSDCYACLLDLALAPQRWSTKAKAMSALCLKIIVVCKMIELWSKDPDPNHRERKYGRKAVC